MFKVYKESCKNCLLSPDAIVSPSRRSEIIKGCAEEQTHFICHVASIEGEDICCKTFYDTLGHKSQMIRIAERLGMVELIDQPETEKLVSHKELNKKK